MATGATGATGDHTRAIEGVGADRSSWRRAETLDNFRPSSPEVRPRNDSRLQDRTDFLFGFRNTDLSRAPLPPGVQFALKRPDVT